VTEGRQEDFLVVGANRYLEEHFGAHRGTEISLTIMVTTRNPGS